jgi:hypothetical protein
LSKIKQKHLIEEYIKPQLRGDDLVKEFGVLLESEKCQDLEWQVLTDVVRKIIDNKSALAQMFEKYADIGFKDTYEQHFIQNIMTFKSPSWHNKPLESMCAELTMRKWH